MASVTSAAPQIDIEVSLDRQTHSFHEASAPTFKLRVTSRATTPITVFTWNTPLDLPRALTNKCISITNSTTGEPVQQSHVQVQRPALKREKDSLDEKYFVTLQPNTPLEFSSPFGPAGEGVKPQPKSDDIVKQAYDRQRNVKEFRKQRLATGVDGLEQGQTYIISLETEPLQKMWWAPVDRQEILVSDSGAGSYVQDYAWEKTPLEFDVKNTQLQVKD